MDEFGGWIGGPRGTASLINCILGENSGGVCDGDGNSCGDGGLTIPGDGDGSSMGIDGTGISDGLCLGISVGIGTGKSGPFVGGSSSGNGDGGSSVGTSGTSVPGELGGGASLGVVSGRNSGNVTGIGFSDGVGRLGSGTEGLGSMEGVTSGLGSRLGRMTDEICRRTSA